jgi:hypothetical protein
MPASSMPSRGRRGPRAPRCRRSPGIPSHSNVCAIRSGASPPDRCRGTLRPQLRCMNRQSPPVITSILSTIVSVSRGPQHSGLASVYAGSTAAAASRARADAHTRLRSRAARAVERALQPPRTPTGGAPVRAACARPAKGNDRAARDLGRLTARASAQRCQPLIASGVLLHPHSRPAAQRPYLTGGRTAGSGRAR